MQWTLQKDLVGKQLMFAMRRAGGLAKTNFKFSHSNLLPNDDNNTDVNITSQINYQLELKLTICLVVFSTKNYFDTILKYIFLYR